MDAHADAQPGAATADGGDVSGSDTDELVALGEALETAAELPLDERLALLQQAEATIARALEGLDGL